MSRYFLGIITAFLFLATVCVMLYVFDQGGVIDLKPSILIALSYIPGWEEIPEAYELGLKNREALLEREKQLQEKARALDEQYQQFKKEQAQFKAEQRRFERERFILEQKLREYEDKEEQKKEESLENAARLLESMKPEAAGKALQEMDFSEGVLVLSLLNPRKAGKILDTLPPEKSSRYLELMTWHEGNQAK